jgi:hypothetical protein
MTAKDHVLAAAVAAGRVKPIAGLPEAMSAHKVIVDEIDRRPLIQQEKARLTREAAAARGFRP